MERERREARDDREREPLGAKLRSVSWGVVLPLAAALFLGFGSLTLVKLIARPLALLVVGVTLAEALEPIVRRLSERLHRRGLSIALVYVALAAIAVGLGYLVLPTVVTQARELIDRLPTLLSEAQEWLRRRMPVGVDLTDLSGGLPSQVGGLAVSLPVRLFGVLLDTFVVIFLSVYWLYGRSAIRRFTLSLFPASERERATGVLHEMARSMGGYVRGTVINAVIMGVLAWLGLMIIGMPYALALGVLTMLGEIVPIIGPVVVGSIVTLLALVHSLTLALVALALFVGLEQLEGHILTPNIMRSQTHVPQTLVLFAIVVGAGLGGILGILVAIPLAAALRIFVLRVAAPAEREMVDGAHDDAQGVPG